MWRAPTRRWEYLSSELQEWVMTGAGADVMLLHDIRQVGGGDRHESEEPQGRGWVLGRLSAALARRGEVNGDTPANTE